jgi:hypothetical protein
MHFRTFLKAGIEVLHLGMQHTESNAWPLEHWRANPGRWRLFTPGIDEYLNEDLADKSFGTSIDKFVLLLEVADIASWGVGLAFTGPEGYSSYKPKTRELWSVGQLNWPEVQMLTAKQQLQAYRVALVSAIHRASEAKRKPKDFNAEGLAHAVTARLQSVKVSQLSRAAFIARSEA